MNLNIYCSGLGREAAEIMTLCSLENFEMQVGLKNEHKVM